MAIFKIKGGVSLKGNIIPQGAKNEALQVLSAVLLTPEKVRIKNIPNIKDVKKLIFTLNNIGVKIKKNGENDYTFEAKKINFKYIFSKKFLEDTSFIRGSILITGPLLGRFKKVFFPKPGGDKIGRRRIDTHFKGLISLGATYKYYDNGYYKLEAKQLIGKDILLEEASITGTANTIMASIFAKGRTIIYNAACEPYIQQLCKMLNCMGAKISGIGSNLLIIHGINYLNGCEHNILPDMVEIGSWIGLAAVTNSEITIKNVSWNNLGIIPNTFRKMGINLKKINDDIYIPKHKNYSIQKFMDGSMLSISDSPWPGLTPDLLSILLVVAIQAQGSVLIHQKMFESRLFFAEKLIDMGAQIILCDPHRAVVIGLNKKFSLRANTLISPDIRAGLSFIIAALSATGYSYIHNIEQIDRGYENIDKRLISLGADIVRM
jgi:UDP-N-acetylglucosamine 1-carboxyvinyltransferase